MSRDDLIKINGKVVKVHAGGHFTVDCENGVTLKARLSGRLQRFHIRVLLGDDVTVAVSPYDTSHGMIVHRDK